MSTVYQVQRRFTEKYRGSAPLYGAQIGEWHTPPYGPRRIKETLGTARQALSTYRKRNPPGVEYRLVKLEGEWTEVTE